MKVFSLAVMLFFTRSVIGAYSQETEISPIDAKRIIEKRAIETIEVIKNKDFKHLSRLTHQDKGLIFSPYPYVTGHEKGLNKNKIAFISFKDTKIFQTVAQDGSGDDVEYTFGKYYKTFIYPKDFANAPTIHFNEHVSTGNCGINLYDKFPGSIIVEYYFPGFVPKREGMDWQSLFLVFEKADDSNWYLVDIAHDNWCI